MKKRLICLSLVFALAATQAMPVMAARKDDVQAEKADTQSKLSIAEDKASQLETKKNELLNEIDSLDQNLVQVMAQIDILDGEIAEKEVEIEDTQVKLAEAEAERDKQYEAMKKRIQYLYEKGGSNAWAQMILETKSITDMLSKAEYTEKMYAYDRSELKEMKEVVQQVTDLGNQLAQDKADFEGMKVEQEGQKANLQTVLDEKKSTASDYESQIATVESQAAEYRSLIEQQNAELQKIQEEEQKAAEEAARQAEAQRAAQAETEARQNSAQRNSSNQSSGSGSGSSSGNASNSEDESSKSDSSSSGSGSSGSYSATGEAVVAYASQFIGNPYVYGGTSMTNGIDCSAYVQQVFGHFGYSLPRVSDAQASSGRGISYSEARAGDIIVYSGHVAILTGDGGIVHASNSAPYPQGGIKYSPNALYRSYIAVRRIVE